MIWLRRHTVDNGIALCMFIADRAVLTTYGAHNQVDVISMSKELGKQPWEIDDERLPDLWGLSAQWLLDRGYRLYNPCPENRYDSAICEPPQTTQWDFQHPYAFHAYIPSQPFDEVSFQVRSLLSVINA